MHELAAVHVKHLVDEFIIEIGERRARHQASGIVDQHINAAMHFHCRVDECGGCSRVRQVKAQGFDASGFDCLQFLAAAQILRHNLGACRCKAQRCSTANAGDAAGDDDNPVLQIIKH